MLPRALVEPDRAIVLSAGDQPVRIGGIERQIFDLRYRQALVERPPCPAAVGRTVEPAVIARIDDPRIGGVESEAMLIRMDAVRTVGHVVAPRPIAGGEIAAEAVD